MKTIKKPCRDDVSTQQEEYDIVDIDSQEWMCWALSLGRKGLSGEVTFGGR